MHYLYKALSVLLSYPQEAWVSQIGHIAQKLNENPQAQALAAPLISHLSSNDLITLQENYVLTFDRNPAHALHMFEHIHGEEKTRGQALIDLQNEYQRFGFMHHAQELPDYLPLFLEFLALIPTHDAHKLLDEAIHVIAHIGNKLKSIGSPYSGLFDLLQKLSTVKAQKLSEAPVHTMDEALVTFSPDYGAAQALAPTFTGCRPCSPKTLQQHPVHFMPKNTASL